MKTQNSPWAPISSTRPVRILGCLLCFLSLAPALAPTLAFGQAPVELRPNQSDAASSQLVQNFLKVSGGSDRHNELRNVVATGTIKESTLERRFELIETNNGERRIAYSWTHLGRNYEVIYAHDGVVTWKQEIAPKKEQPKTIGGIDGQHFGEVLWLIHPLTLPRYADYVFEYRGNAKVKGRPAHLVRGFGKENRPMWLYFDRENFLITRWGSIGLIAGVEEYIDYQATRFQRVDGLVFPSVIELVAENAVYGRVVFETIHTNQDLEGVSFLKPHSTVPMLRQRPVSTN